MHLVVCMMPKTVCCIRCAGVDGTRVLIVCHQNAEPRRARSGVSVPRVSRSARLLIQQWLAFISGKKPRNDRLTLSTRLRRWLSRFAHITIKDGNRMNLTNIATGALPFLPQKLVQKGGPR